MSTADHPEGRHSQPEQARESVKLALSDAQVEEVLRGVAGVRGGGLHGFLLAWAGRLDQSNTTVSEELANNPKLSLSLLRALAILRFLATEGGEQPLYDIARGVEGTISTTRRYLLTLKRIGLIEQFEETRKYQLAAIPKAEIHHGSSAASEFARAALCDPQVEEVLQGVIQEKHGGRGGLRGFLVGRTGRLEQLGLLRDRDLPGDPEISRSLLRALLILRFLFLKDGAQPLYAIAPGVGLSSSTTHRYLATLKEVGLIEQVEATHQYRLAMEAGV